MSARVWLPAPGVVLVHRSAGFPMPPLDLDARAALGPPVSRWPWRRDDVWPCHGVEAATDEHPGKPWWRCTRLAVYRHAGPGPTRGYYCPAHVPTRPAGAPVPLCAECTGPLDPTITEGTHLTCAPRDGTATEADALVTLLATFPDIVETP